MDGSGEGVKPHHRVRVGLCDEERLYQETGGRNDLQEYLLRETTSVSFLVNCFVPGTVSEALRHHFTKQLVQ